MDKELCEFTSAAFVILGICIGFLFSIWHARQQRADIAKESFLTVTSDLRAKLETMETQPEQFFIESLPVLRLAVHRASPFMNGAKWARLHQSWKDYETTNPKDIDGSLSAAMRSLHGPSEKLAHEHIESLIKNMELCFD